jgi:hypothetical protein
MLIYGTLMSQEIDFQNARAYWYRATNENTTTSLPQEVRKRKYTHKNCYETYKTSTSSQYILIWQTTKTERHEAIGTNTVYSRNIKFYAKE